MESIQIVSPVEGKVVDIEDVQDEVFSEKLLGDGIAVIPSSNKIVSPIDGEVTMVYPTLHAVGIKDTNTGVELLIHIGIDTAELNGKYYKCFIKKGQIVKQDQEIMHCDFDQIKKRYDPTAVIIVTHANDIVFKKTEQSYGRVGDVLLYGEK